jgi:hypothetical protein
MRREAQMHLLPSQLGAARGDKSMFFVFADTVATRSFSRR